jgi:hypothetical protein
VRTTLDLDDEILQAAKELARQRRVAIGKVISGLVREALTHQSAASDATPTVAGFRPFSSDGRVVTNAQVDVLRDAEGV